MESMIHSKCKKITWKDWGNS